MNYLFYNPDARNGKVADDLVLIRRTLEGQEIKEYNLLDLPDYSELLKDVELSDVIYLVGGDGTLNRFINDAYNLKIGCDIYFYSAGTGNDFKHDVDADNKLYRIQINEYIKNLPIVTVKGKDYRFINGVGFGIDGYCCEEGDRLRAKSDKPVNYTSIAVKGCLSRFKPCNARVTVDGVTKSYPKVWLAPTMMGKYYGGGMMVAPDQNRENKEHTVSSVVLYGTGRLKTLMRFPKIFTGEHVVYKDMIDIRKGHNIKVEFDKPCALQIDGETITGVTEYTVKYE